MSLRNIPWEWYQQFLRQRCALLHEDTFFDGSPSGQLAIRVGEETEWLCDVPFSLRTWEEMALWSLVTGILMLPKQGQITWKWK